MVRQVQVLVTKHLSDVRSKFRIAFMFLPVNIQRMFYTDFVGMFIIYRHIKSHIPPSSDSLALTITPGA
jgi:hypothetical protein